MATAMTAAATARPVRVGPLTPARRVRLVVPQRTRRVFECRRVPVVAFKKEGAAESVASDPTATAMFCYQCEQTKKGQGCFDEGVCGKQPSTAALQDLLVYQLKALAGWAVHAQEVAGIVLKDANWFWRAAIFATLTNVNFDDKRFLSYVQEAARHVAALQAAVATAGAPPLVAPDVPWFGNGLPHPYAWDMAEVQGANVETLVDLGRKVGLAERLTLIGNETLLGLHELITYGVKGAAAYSHHAAVVGWDNDEHCYELQKQLAFVCTPEAADVGAVLGTALAVGATNLKVTGLLEEAHTTTFGVPSPTSVSTTPREGKCILVTGHDLRDLKAILDLTQGTGINVYTHGELLPAHGYPELRAYDNLAGHFGGAWYQQKIDFAMWPGSILVTTNCVLDPPANTYAANIFTTGETGVPGVAHVPEHKDFAAVVDRAKELPGFDAAAAKKEGKPLLVGFGRETMLGAAPAVLDAVKEGKLTHLFLIGGCDGMEGSRKYYERVAQQLPPSSAVLTLGCAKYRLLGQDWGTVPGTELPRLLDMGQCNDSYAAVQVAVALADALGVEGGVNGLPLSLDLSWFEQKAVAVLLSLLHLGVKDIRLGPSLPAFLTPDAVQVLVDTFDLKPPDLKHPEEDIQSMLQHGH